MPHALIGGLAVGVHGHVRATRDVDFLVGSEAFASMAPLLVFRPELSGLVQIGHTDLMSVPPAYPSLAAELQQGEEVPVISLDALVLMKLDANRPRDREDVRVLLGGDRARVRSARDNLEAHAPPPRRPAGRGPRRLEVTLRPRLDFPSGAGILTTRRRSCVATATLYARREVAAPPEVVFDAWIDERLTARFLAEAPVGRLQHNEIHASLDGFFRFVYADRGGGLTEHTGRYLTIERPSVLAFTFAVHRPPTERPGTALEAPAVTVRIRPTASGCEVELSHDAVPLGLLELTLTGWQRNLDVLAQLFQRAE